MTKKHISAGKNDKLFFFSEKLSIFARRLAANFLEELIETSLATIFTAE